MAENLHEEKTARHLDRLSEALDSGTQYQVRHLLNSLSASEIGDLLESLPIAKRLAVWEMTDPELEGDVLVEVNDEVRASLIRDTAPEDLVAAVDDLDLDDLADIHDDRHRRRNRCSGVVVARVRDPAHLHGVARPSREGSPRPSGRCRRWKRMYWLILLLRRRWRR